MMPMIKKRIDNMPYSEMLRVYRKTSTGTILFQGDHGTYFRKVMNEKRLGLTKKKRKDIAKKTGW